MRSVSVKESYRGQSLGYKIVDDLLLKAKEKRVKDIFLLTETASKFFTKKGFKKISRDLVPEEVKASSEFLHICPVTADCMFYKLD
jgi:amino-acid N-acetyltransferase